MDFIKKYWLRILIISLLSLIILFFAGLWAFNSYLFYSHKPELHEGERLWTGHFISRGGTVPGNEQFYGGRGRLFVVLPEPLPNPNEAGEEQSFPVQVKLYFNFWTFFSGRVLSLSGTGRVRVEDAVPLISLELGDDVQPDILSISGENYKKTRVSTPEEVVKIHGRYVTKGTRFWKRLTKEYQLPDDATTAMKFAEKCAISLVQNMENRGLLVPMDDESVTVEGEFLIRK